MLNINSNKKTFFKFNLFEKYSRELMKTKFLNFRYEIIDNFMLCDLTKFKLFSILSFGEYGSDLGSISFL